MTSTSGTRWGIGAIVAICVLSAAPTAQARDFYHVASLMHSPTIRRWRHRGPSPSLRGRCRSPAKAISSAVRPSQPRPRVSYGGGGGQAYCVRTCDGRYFPISAGDGQSRAASCNSFCPASETKVVYGSSIDHAATENGKPYSELPNAFRYRNELVAGCTCNGKDQLGLAPVKIEDDPTLRKGDIVAGANGLVVAARAADRRGASLNFSPASAQVRAKYQRLPVVAAE